MGYNHKALIGPVPENAFGESGYDQGFPRSCRQHKQRITLVLLKVGVDRVDGCLLVRAKRQHDTASSSLRASLTQLVPSFMR